MKRILLGLWFGLVWTGLAFSAETAEDKKLEAYFKVWLRHELDAQPVLATRLGDHRNAEKIERIDAPTRLTWRVGWEQTLTELPKAIAKSKLSTQGRVNFEIFEHNLRRQIWQAENLKVFDRDPRVYSEYLGDCTFLLITQSTLSKGRAAEASLSRIRAIPKWWPMPGPTYPRIRPRY